MLRNRIALAASLVLAAAGAAVLAQSQDVKRFSATTRNMTPDGEMLRIDVLHWSSDEERTKAVAVLAGGPATAPAGEAAGGGPAATPDADADEAAAPEADAGGPSADDINALPTLGYVWPSSSSLGFAIKYATHEMAADGSERITLVTARRLGAYGLEPWAATESARGTDEPFTVLVLRLKPDDTGDGTMSFAAEPMFDASAGTVALAHADTAPVLLEARRGQPLPGSAP